MAIEQDHYELDELNINDRTTLVDVCVSLVVIDEQSNTSQALAHLGAPWKIDLHPTFS